MSHPSLSEVRSIPAARMGTCCCSSSSCSSATVTVTECSSDLLEWGSPSIPHNTDLCVSLCRGHKHLLPVLATNCWLLPWTCTTHLHGTCHAGISPAWEDGMISKLPRSPLAPCVCSRFALGTFTWIFTFWNKKWATIPWLFMCPLCFLVLRLEAEWSSCCDVRWFLQFWQMCKNQAVAKALFLALLCILISTGAVSHSGRSDCSITNDFGGKARPSGKRLAL